MIYQYQKNVKQIIRSYCFRKSVLVRFCWNVYDVSLYDHHVVVCRGDAFGAAVLLCDRNYGPFPGLVSGLPLAAQSSLHWPSSLSSSNRITTYEFVIQ